MLARSGAYSVKTRIIDDDNNKWLDDFEWCKSPVHTVEVGH